MQTVEKFLIDKLGSSVNHISELSSGMFSKAYAYKLNGDGFVLRLKDTMLKIKSMFRISLKESVAIDCILVYRV